jgi:hypothetical protein
VQKENESEVLDFHIPERTRDFSPRHIAETGSGTHPASYPVKNWVFTPGLRRPRHETDYSLPSRIEVKNSGATPPQFCTSNELCTGTY